MLEDLKGAQSVMERGLTGLDLVKGLEADGFRDVAENLLTVLRQRVSGDLLQTVGDPDARLRRRCRAINDANDYAGPGTGYRLSGERWEEMKKLRHVTSASNPETEVELTMTFSHHSSGRSKLREIGPARRGTRPDEVVIALSPAFGGFFSKTIVDVPHAEVLRQLLAGIEEQGVTARVIQVHDTADLAAISHPGAQLSGSGIGDRHALPRHHDDPPEGPGAAVATWSCSRRRRCSTPQMFRQIGSNAARYAKGESPEPVPTRNDQMARPAGRPRRRCCTSRSSRPSRPDAGRKRWCSTSSCSSAG